MPRLRKDTPTEELIQLRTALAMNMRAYMAANPLVRGLKETAAAELVGKEAGVGKNTVLRALGAAKDGSDLRLDNLVKLATFFGVEAGDLLRDHRSVAERRATYNKKQTRPARDQRMEADVDRAALHRPRRA